MTIIKRVLAQKENPLGNLKGIGDVGLEGLTPDQGGEVLARILSSVIGIMTFAGALWFIIRIIVGGYHFMTADNDTGKIGEAKETIRNSVIGLGVVVIATFILSFVGWLFHVDFLNVVETITKLAP